MRDICACLALLVYLADDGRTSDLIIWCATGSVRRGGGVPVGEMVCTQGERGEDFFVLLQGVVEVVIDGNAVGLMQENVSHAFSGSDSVNSMPCACVWGLQAAVEWRFL